jgi:DNA-binding response OmpR family regulator
MAIKVLIIEDDVTLNDMYSMKFEIDWFDVESAFDWMEWLEKIKEFRPEAILLDIMMPWINWIETISLIKELVDYPVKIIMFTNLNDKKNMEMAMEKWADDFVLKADTTPKQAVEKVLKLLWKESAR